MPQFKEISAKSMGTDEYQGTKVLSPLGSLGAFRLPDGFAIKPFALE